LTVNAQSDVGSSAKDATAESPSRMRVIPVLITLGIVISATVIGWVAWQAYMATPWTRDGTVRAYVVTMAPEVAGRIVALSVMDNQYVRKGDLLLQIDPTDYAIAVRRNEGAVEQARANAQNAQAESRRRQQLSDLAVTAEQKQTYASNALAAQATYEQAVANLNQASANLERTRILAPVNGYITNLLVRAGDYAMAGQAMISIVDADSFWVDGYFEETNLEAIHEGAPANIKLMGYRSVVRGHVSSVARGITVPNARPDQSGLASVNPIFTWVRLAQRVPVRIDIDRVPDGVRLVQGMTATVELN
jgi:multidrug resistance efflux pump